MSRSRHGVERRRGLVEDEDPRVLEQDPRDRDALLLAARELVAALADHRVVALGQLDDPVVDGGGARRGLQLGVGRVRPGVAQVVADRGVEEVRLLGHEADRSRPSDASLIRRTSTPSISTAPLSDVVQPRDQVGRGGLARPGRADERDELARLGLEVDLLERERGRASQGRGRTGPRTTRAVRAAGHASRSRRPRAPPRRSARRRVGHGLLGRGSARSADVAPAASVPSPARTGRASRRVAERHVAEADPAAHVAGSSATASGASTISGSMSRYSKIRSNSASDALDLHLDVEQLAEREEEPALQRGERDDRAGRRARLGCRSAASVPASQYTNAGMMLKIVPMIMKNQRPDHRLADLEAASFG